MKGLICAVTCLMLLTAVAAQANDLTVAGDTIKALTERITTLSGGKVGENSTANIAAAQATLGAAKAAVSASNAVLALQKAELASIQLDVAEARSAELEASEQLVLRRAELKKFEGQFDQLLQTGGK